MPRQSTPLTRTAREITFGGDGTFDLLTNTYTPRFFYSHLDREIALANRAHSQSRIYPISLISFRLPIAQAIKIRETVRASTQVQGKKRQEKVDDKSVAQYEQLLISTARTLEKSMREGDVLARIYESGFVISTRNTSEGIEAMRKRMHKILPVFAEISCIERKEGESRLILISRLDAQYFSHQITVDK